jgi:hypothetical protein
MYHVSIVHMHVRTLPSDDEIIVSVTRREQQLEQTCLTICFLLLFCFDVVLFCFYFVCLCMILVGQSLFVCVVDVFSCLSLHCLSFDLRLRITPLVSSNYSYIHHVVL